MKYRITVDDIMTVREIYCNPRACDASGCAIIREIKAPFCCAEWVRNHPKEAAKLMGAEIVEEET